MVAATSVKLLAFVAAGKPVARQIYRTAELRVQVVFPLKTVLSLETILFSFAHNAAL